MNNELVPSTLNNNIASISNGSAMYLMQYYKSEKCVWNLCPHNRGYKNNASVLMKMIICNNYYASNRKEVMDSEYVGCLQDWQLFQEF